MRTKLLIEQHFHGAFGVDFNTATVDEILFLSKEILKYGVGGIFPTIVTDSVENVKKAIANIKEASQKQTSGMAKILGIHLEGIFLNPEKKGIHNPEYFLEPTIDNYKLIEDNFIKIVTLAPEQIFNPRPLRERKEFQREAVPNVRNSREGLINYLHSKGIKIQAGHCVGGDLTGCSGVTHLFNAMSGISHRGSSTALSALIDDNIYTEIIADGVHVSDDILKLVFKAKPLDKIILISDCLPCACCNCHSEERSDVNISLNNEITTSNVQHPTRNDIFIFAGEKIYYDGFKATSEGGTLAGSTMLLPKIIKRLIVKLFNPSPEFVNSHCSLTNSTLSRRGEVVSQLIQNPYNYHNVDLKGYIEWDEDFNILEVNYE